MTTTEPAAPHNPPTPIAVTALASATDRLLRTVRALPPDAWAAPSVLPGWTRAHVLAHLALNAKGLAGVLNTVGDPDPLPMYASNIRRDADIDDLAAQPPERIAGRVAVGAAVLAARLGGGPTPEGALDGGADDAFQQALAESAAADPCPWTTGREPVPGTFDRVTGGPALPIAEVPFMRWREVEIHHADLDAGYGPADWPEVFIDYLLPLAAYDRSPEIDVTLRPAGRPEIAVGAGGPPIAGRAFDLVWWLIGRGRGARLTGSLPTLGPWIGRSRFGKDSARIPTQIHPNS